MTAIITARNEARVVGNLLRDLAAQRLVAEHPESLDVVLIDDASSDGTSSTALEAATAAGLDRFQIVRREAEGPRLKSDALSAVPPESCRGELIVHFDADARIDPEFLTVVRRYAAAGVEAMTARRAVLPRAGLIAAGQADEIVADGMMLHGRAAAGGMSDFRGNGAIVSRRLLQQVGGWPSALTEDVELSTRIAAASGIAVVWARDAVVWEEPVLTFGGLWRQRVRWAEGVLRRTFRYAPAVMTSKRLSRAAKVDFVLYALQLALPSVILGGLFGALFGAPRKRFPGVALSIVVAYGLLQVMLAWSGLADEPHWRPGQPYVRRPPSPVRRGIRSLRAALFAVIWIGTIPRAAVLIATRRGGLSFAKTVHLDSTFEAAPPIRTRQRR